MRSHAERPATSSRSTDHVQSCAARRPASQSHALPSSPAELGHRFERIAIDSVRSGERQAGEGVGRLRPSARPAPIQRKQVWNGVWLGETEEHRRVQELEAERQREQERQRQLELRRQEEERQRLERQREEERLREEEEKERLRKEKEEEERLRMQKQKEEEERLRMQKQKEEEERLRMQKQEEEERLRKQKEEEEQHKLKEERHNQTKKEKTPLLEDEQEDQFSHRNEVGSSRSYGSFHQPSGDLKLNRSSLSDSDHGGMDSPLLGQKKPSGWSRFKSWVGRSLDSNAANFVSINSPGTQTGVVGGASGVNSFLSPPSQIKSSASFTAKTGPYTGGIGAGLNMLGGVSDLVATGQGLNNMSKEGGIRGFGRGLWDTLSKPFSRRKQKKETGTQAETRSTAKRLAVDLPVNLADASSQGMQGANAISSLVHGGTSVLSPVLGVASAGIGTGVQGIVAGRAAWRMGRAWHHKRKIDKLRTSQRYQEMSKKNQDAADYMSDQLGKRRTRNLIGGLGATAGAVGGGLLLGGLLGGAALLTPIGWGLVGAGALVAAGLGIHKLYKHFKKKGEGTLGTERDTHANNLHRAVVGDNDQDRRDALKILKSHGITKAQARDPVKGKQLIKRKLEGW